ncbi:hypothetical protein ACFQ38_02635 [Sporosarcina contaminans]|uniref:YopX protein domain-containing protein n=1 Tax=Sporosarcina contaminans TaxID=633403 RepID=A0ABW3TTE4_9BACL
MKKYTDSHKRDLALGDSERTDKPIRFIPKKHIYWEDWGHMCLVFRQGVIYEGIQHSDGNVTAESPAYGVTDYVDTTEIEILH